jgi:hypothetical protein
LPGYLTSSPRITGLGSRHVATHITGREIVIALIIIVFAAGLVVVPVLWGAAFDSFSSGMSKAAWPSFLTGFGILIVGLATGVRIIVIAGIAFMVAVVVGVIAEKYLIFGLAAAFVVPHADDYRALHPTLLLDLYGELLYHHAHLHLPVPDYQASLDGASIGSVEDLRAALARTRKEWAELHALTAGGLLTAEVTHSRVYRMGWAAPGRTSFSASTGLASGTCCGPL